MPSKLEKFAEIEQFSNVFSFGFRQLKEAFFLKGNWHKTVFQNTHPLVLELGCGKGEYTLGLARKHPEKNYIGVDLKGNRIWTGAKQALDEGLRHVAFLKSRIDFIEHCFAKAEVDEIWITFPDPQPQKPRARKRLTHPVFLQRYKTLLKPGAIIHLKTDSSLLYEYTLEVIASEKLILHWHSSDLYRDCPPERSELTGIQTYYERLFTEKGERIKYLSFSFPSTV